MADIEVSAHAWTPIASLQRPRHGEGLHAFTAYLVSRVLCESGHYLWDRQIYLHTYDLTTLPCANDR
jgi:hypothetical protein